MGLHAEGQGRVWALGGRKGGSARRHGHVTMKGLASSIIMTCIIMTSLVRSFNLQNKGLTSEKWSKLVRNLEKLILFEIDVQLHKRVEPFLIMFYPRKLGVPLSSQHKSTAGGAERRSTHLCHRGRAITVTALHGSDG